MTVFVSDHYVLRKGDNIQAYSIYSVRHYSKVENDNIKKIIAPVNKPLRIDESENVCHMLTTDWLTDCLTAWLYVLNIKTVSHGWEFNALFILS